MRAKTELFLYHLLWRGEIAVRPTFANLTTGFEAWAYRRGLHGQVRRLEEQGYLESVGKALDERRFHRLTEVGRLAALGGRDPEKEWAERWDRKWRLCFFDVPESRRSLRQRLLRALRGAGWGCLQRSVWICPRSAEGMDAVLRGDGTDVAHLMMLEADSRGSAEDRRMVQAAWDFGRLNRAYDDYLEVLDGLPEREAKIPTAEALLAWSKAEHAAWLKAVRLDPLLPTDLLPKEYAGRRAWKRRKQALQRAGEFASQVEVPDPVS